MAHGGRSYKIDIYLRNWSIRTELQRRAYLYNIENESFSQPELNVPTEQRLSNGENNNSSSSSSTTESLPTAATQTTAYPMNFLSGQEQLYENRSNCTANNRNNQNHNRATDQQGQQHLLQQQQQQQHRDLLYQKQYCKQIKVIQSDLMRTNDVNIGILSEINTTARKHTTVSTAAVNDLEIDTLRILCEKNELIVDRCGTWSSKNIHNCSVKKAAAIGAKPSTTTTLSVSSSSASSKSTHTKSKSPTNAEKQSPKIYPFTAVPRCESGKAAKPSSAPPSQLKLKTQNTFISRLLLTDILDNI